MRGGRKHIFLTQMPEHRGTGVGVIKKDLFEGFWPADHVVDVKRM